MARAAPGVPLGAWLEPRPSGLRVRSGGLSRCSEPSDHLQAGGSLSMHRELCAHSPTGNTGKSVSQPQPRLRVFERLVFHKVFWPSNVLPIP